MCRETLLQISKLLNTLFTLNTKQGQLTFKLFKFHDINKIPYFPVVSFIAVNEVFHGFVLHRGVRLCFQQEDRVIIQQISVRWSTKIDDNYLAEV